MKTKQRFRRLPDEQQSECEAELLVGLRGGTAAHNDYIKSLIKQTAIAPMCLGKILILADLALIKINKIKNRPIQNRFLDHNSVLKYTCTYTPINALLLVSLCNEQILALDLEESSPLKSNAWFIMTASPAPLNLVIFFFSPHQFQPSVAHFISVHLSLAPEPRMFGSFGFLLEIFIYPLWVQFAMMMEYEAMTLFLRVIRLN